MYGISLVDGTPCGCDIGHCGLRLTVEEADKWKYEGPSDVDHADSDTLVELLTAKGQAVSRLSDHGWPIAELIEKAAEE